MNTKRLVQRIATATRSLYTTFDATIGRPKGVTCARGCAHCCNLLVFWTIPEAVAALSEARARGWNVRVGAPAERLSTQRAALREPVMTQAVWVQRRVPCPFLTDTAECSIYAMRPCPCRAYLVVSEPRHCDTRVEATVGVLDTSAFQWQILRGLTELSAEMGLLSCGFSPTAFALDLAAVLMTKGVDAANEALRAERMASHVSCATRWHHLWNHLPAQVPQWGTG